MAPTHNGSRNATPPHRGLRLHVEAAARTAISCLLLALVVPAAGQDEVNDTSTPLPRQWSFRMDADEVGTEHRWFDPEVAQELVWQKLLVTAPWGEQLLSDDPVDPVMLEYHGVAWYWTPFQAPEVDEGDRLWLEAGEIKGDVGVYINGESLADTKTAAPQQPASEGEAASQGEARPHRYDITPQLKPGENHVMIRVESRQGEGGITKPVVLRRSARNVVLNPSFANGFDGWRWSTASGKGEVQPQLAPGYFTTGQSVRLDGKPADTVILDQMVDQAIAVGERWRVTVRYRQEIGEHDGDPPLRVVLMTYPKRERRQPHDKLWLDGQTTSTDSWVETKGVFEAKEDYTHFRIGVFINGAGVYHVDEVTVVQVGSSARPGE